jgi:hypothetical protein
VADEPEDVLADMQAGPEVASGEQAEAEPEPQIEVSALNVEQALAMGKALEAFRFFNHTVARSAIGATVREVLVEIHGVPWCRLKVSPTGTAYVEPLMPVTEPVEGS